MSEGRRAINFAAIAALVLAVAAGAAAGYVYQRQENGLGNLEKQVKDLRDKQKGAETARLSMQRLRLASSRSLTEGMQGIWTAVRAIQKDLRAVDGRVAKLEEKIGGSPAIDALKKRLEAVSARSVLLQARVEALERRKGGASRGGVSRGGTGKTNFVNGGGRKSGTTAGSRKSRGTGGTSGKPKQPPFWDGCIDSLNKSARLATSAESVCDCIVGRIKKSGKVSAKDRARILSQSKFTTRVRGISSSSQTVLETAVVQCALRQFKKKK